MERYEVECAHRETGEPYVVAVRAASDDAAIALAASMGHLASRASRRAPPAVPAESLNDVLAELRAIRMLLQNGPRVRNLGSVMWGAVLAWLFIIGVTAAVWFVLMVLFAGAVAGLA